MLSRGRGEVGDSNIAALRAKKFMNAFLSSCATTMVLLPLFRASTSTLPTMEDAVTNGTAAGGDVEMKEESMVEVCLTLYTGQDNVGACVDSL